VPQPDGTYYSPHSHTFFLYDKDAKAFIACVDPISGGQSILQPDGTIVFIFRKTLYMIQEESLSYLYTFQIVVNPHILKMIY